MVAWAIVDEPIARRGSLIGAKPRAGGVLADGVRDRPRVPAEAARRQTVRTTIHPRPRRHQHHHHQRVHTHDALGRAV